MKGIRHLIQCHCVLPQFRRRSTPVFHKFPVFSIFDSNDTIEKKFAQCENCGVIHKVIDLCRSEILSGKDELISIMSIVDIKLSMPDKLSNMLETYNCDISTWEHVQFIIDSELWGESVAIKKDEHEDISSIKILEINGENKFKIKTVTRKEVI